MTIRLVHLALVDVVVGVDRVLAAQLAPHHLDGSVADVFVYIHVGLGSRPSLPHHQGEVVIQFTVCHLQGMDPMDERPGPIE